MVARTALVAVLVLAPAGARAQDDPLERARTAFALSRYAVAEEELAKVPGLDRKGDALVLRARIALRTGRYAEAAESARRAVRMGGALEIAAAPWLAEALARQGKTAEALKALEDVKTEPAAHRARVALGELLIRAGRRAEAREPLKTVVVAYNNGGITDADAEGLSLVGRASYLLRNDADANDAFNMAERAGGRKRVETLLWRAEHFLEKYDPGDASRVVKEALALAPEDPHALVASAHVKLDQTMDFAAAEEAVARALAIDPHLASAHFVRAGLALRTMDLATAEAAADAGLRTNPVDLELLSIKAATRFLADDRGGFEALEKQVLALNPQYARFYSIVGELAEWEHRYDDIVAMMRKAIAVDDGDGKAHAALGLNLIRAGDEAGGIEALRKAWRRDKYNVRVKNTLDLYEKTIPRDYVTVDGARFRIRYHKRDKAILERYLPAMLERAWGKMVQRYGFSPTTPVGIELYADAEHFSVRTSGLPNVGIQGVCFGQTLAALSPNAGPFNWGMIVWHELAHVFHIQRSKSHVPRWFTEGLAEYETLVERPEWKREEDMGLYQSLRAGKLPRVGAFNRAFTHVESPEQVVQAYYAASQLAVFLAETYGFDKLGGLLGAWGAGKQTAQAVREVLAASADDLDRRFRAWLAPRLARYEKQFVPDLTPPASLEKAREALAREPESAERHVKLVLALMRAGQMREALATLQLALRRDPNHPEALFLSMRLALEQKSFAEAERLGRRLVELGRDGYLVRLRLADVAEHKGDKQAMRAELEAAHRLDPSRVEPLQALYDLGKELGDARAQLDALRALAQLDQHDRRVWHRLLFMLVERGQWEEARQVGEAAVYVDPTNAEIHRLYARALARTGRQLSAVFELNSALVAGLPPADAAAVYRALAEGYRKLGKGDFATRADAYAKQMDALRGQPSAAPAEAPAHGHP
jgi:tetratricopeptide (TPR) repeat protein